VNLGTPLLARAQLTSFVSAAEQTLNILTEQNVQVSLGQLGATDVLVAPRLGDIGAGDFKRSVDAIPAGEAAAREVAERLSAYSVDEAEYDRWRAHQRRVVPPPRIDRLQVDTSGLKFARPESVKAVFAGVSDAQDLQRAVNQLLGTDDFQRIEASSEDGPDGTTLVLRPIEKTWGPNYLRAGISMSADLAGRSDFTVSLDHRATWLDANGLEWRNRASLGQYNSLESELRRPLDLAREWFVAPRVGFTLSERDFFAGDDAVATYRSRRTGFELALGRRFGNFGEAIVSAYGASVSDERTRGQRTIADSSTYTSGWRAALTLDRLDSLDFPTSGSLIQLDTRFARRFAGGEDEYDRIAVGAQQAFGNEGSSVLLAARYETALGSDLPLYDAFSAGGFLNLSGYQRDEILAARQTIVRTVYRHRVAGGSSLLPGLYLGASFEGADVGRRLNGPPTLRTVGGSAFLSAESVLGPFYLGLGYAEGGRFSLYLTVGRP
jgi:NTE family protein